MVQNQTSQSLHFDPATLALAQNIWPEAKTFLRKLVEENSYTFFPEGVQRNAEQIRQQFAFLNFSEISHPCALEQTGEHLILDSGGDGPAIVLVSHMDVVYTPEEQEAGLSGWEEEDGRIVGPGTIDIKGGTVAMWMLMRCLAELEPKRLAAFRWILAWNAAEECLAADFSSWVMAQAETKALACLVFEGDNGEPEHGSFGILHARKGQAVYRLCVQGRGSHSGSGHAEGINAIVKLSELIVLVSGLTDYSRETTVNVGTIHGGIATNRVPDYAEAEFEIRYNDVHHYEEIVSRLKGWQTPGDYEEDESQKSECGVRFELQKETPAWVADAQSTLGAYWVRAGRDSGIKVTVGSRGGLSDANFFSTWTQTVDGLGPGGGKAHSILRNGDSIRITEFVEEASFVPKTCLNVQALRKLMTQSLDGARKENQAT